MHFFSRFFSVSAFSLVLLSFSLPGPSGRLFRKTGLAPVEHVPSATFSYNLDGARVSGGEVDELMINNAVYVNKTVGNPDKLIFFLSDGYNETSSLFAHSLRFTVPDKQGTVSIAADDKWQVEFFLAGGNATQYSMYANDAFTVNVTSISSTRVTGTFSGKLKLIPGTGNGKAEYNVTDGKFDLPVRTKQ